MLKTLTLALLLSAPFVVHSAEATVGKKKAPTTIVIIGCRVDDLTGKEGRQDPTLAAKNWRDLEWHFDKGNELECKREVVPLEDASLYAGDKIMPLDPDFSDHMQCTRVGMMYGPKWEAANKGWAVMAAGCPTPIAQDANADGEPDLDENGEPIILEYKLPECPRVIGSLTIKCRFDGSYI
jgi:hypothetical protein